MASTASTAARPRVVFATDDDVVLSKTARRLSPTCEFAAIGDGDVHPARLADASVVVVDCESDPGRAVADRLEAISGDCRVVLLTDGTDVPPVAADATVDRNADAATIRETVRRLAAHAQYDALVEMQFELATEHAGRDDRPTTLEAHLADLRRRTAALLETFSTADFESQFRRLS